MQLFLKQKRGEKLFLILFLSLHHLIYNLQIPLCNYLYSQECKLCNRHIASVNMVGQRATIHGLSKDVRYHTFLYVKVVNHV